MKRSRVWGLVVAGLCVAAFAVAEPWRGEAAPGEKRVALVVGNSAYAYAGRLINPANDAADVAAALTRVGFDVSLVLDSGGAAFAGAVDGFLSRARGAGVAMFYYAGHGMQYEGAPYLVPTDARLENEFSIKRETLAAQDIVSALEGAAHASVVVLDACRNNPLAEQLQQKLAGRGRAAAVSRGLGGVQAVTGNTLVVYSAGPGQVAEDGEGRNSPFTAAFLKHAETPGLEVEQMLKRVTAEVETATGGKQQPERLSRLKIELWLKDGGATVSMRGDDETDAEREWAAVDKNSAPMLETFLRRNGSSLYAEYARAQLEGLRRKESEQRRQPAAQAARAQTPAVARPAPGGAPAPAVTPASAAAGTDGGGPEGRFDDRVAQFVAARYLNGGRGADSVAWLYAPQVDYYGRTGTPRSEVTREVQSYSHAWPSRSYTLLRDSLQIVPRADGGYDVAFEYTFQVSGRKGTRSGRGTARLRLLPEGRDFVVAAEDGKVIERY